MPKKFKSRLGTLFLLLIGLNAFAGGGTWVLEIDYNLNGQPHHGYLVADAWANDYSKYINNQNGFKEAIGNKIKGTKEVIIYDQIVDNEQLSKKASITIPPFTLVRGSETKVMFNKIGDISLIKLWKKSDYVINVLTTLSQIDGNWLSKEAITTHPVGLDVGCRLEVHHFKTTRRGEKLVEEFVNLYKNKDQDKETYLEKSKLLLNMMKNKGIVIIESCGC